MANIFGARPEHPYHLSVGIVALNQNGDVLSLYYPKIDQLTDIYSLPSESIHEGETIEEAAIRGAYEELSCTITILGFLGVQTVTDMWWGELGNPLPAEKTVVFILAKVAGVHKETADEENDRRIVVAKPIEFLIDAMNATPLKDGMRDFNHAKILERAKEWLKNNSNK